MAEHTFAVTSSRPGRPVPVDEIDADILARDGRAVPPGRWLPRICLVSSGRVLPDTRLEIHSDAGEVLGERRVGEIVIRSPSLATGYLSGDAEIAFKDGFRTGDVGYVADGELYATGRRKELIIVAGRNIYPHDVEALAHGVEGVIAGRVVAFGIPDAESGTERLVVLLELNEHESPAAQAIVAEVRHAVSSQLSVAVQVEGVAPRSLRIRCFAPVKHAVAVAQQGQNLRSVSLTNRSRHTSPMSRTPGGGRYPPVPERETATATLAR